MRTISSNVQTLLDLENISYFYCIAIGPFLDLNGASVSLYHTQVPGGVILGGNSYTDDHTLLHVDPPRMSSTVDRESYKLAYADPTFYYRALFEKGFSGVNIVIRVGFYNTTDSNLGSASPGMPLSNIEDTLIIYSGTSDNHGYSIDMGGEVTVTLECTSPMGALAMTKSILTTKDSINQVDSTDTSYDQVFQGSKGIDILWGKVA
jgi:hypothetical protein